MQTPQPRRQPNRTNSRAAVNRAGSSKQSHLLARVFLVAIIVLILLCIAWIVQSVTSGSLFMSLLFIAIAGIGAGTVIYLFASRDQANPNGIQPEAPFAAVLVLLDIALFIMLLIRIF